MAWLAGMVPKILSAAGGFGEEEWKRARDAINNAWKSMAAAGTGAVGDIGGSLPGTLAAVNDAAQKNGVRVIQFCEWFGFYNDASSPWPRRCRSDMTENLMLHSSPCGHALYSTDAGTLRRVKNWCSQHGRVFTFHLAESDEEVEALTEGRGKLVEYYASKVYPANWRPPRMRPACHANSLGLLDASTLAVHGVKLEKAEIDMLAQSGAALCLCPRSNRNLDVGAAPMDKLIEKEVLLCLGTDGLTSNTDLDVVNEARYLRERFDIPWPGLIRMLTVNGYAALGLKANLAQSGESANFCVINGVDF